MGSGNLHTAVRARKNKRQNPFLYPDSGAERWEENANCQGKAFELFEYQDYESPLTKDMKLKARVEFNYANFQMAEEICIECPVFFQCGETATEDDKYWTVRGGEPPQRFLAEKEEYEAKGRPRGAPGQDRTCNKGHLVRGGGRCPECKRATNDRYKARLAEAQNPV